jgi:hypothetical protein
MKKQRLVLGVLDRVPARRDSAREPRGGEAGEEGPVFKVAWIYPGPHNDGGGPRLTTRAG